MKRPIVPDHQGLNAVPLFSADSHASDAAQWTGRTAPTFAVPLADLQRVRAAQPQRRASETVEIPDEVDWTLATQLRAEASKRLTARLESLDGSTETERRELGRAVILETVQASGSERQGRMIDKDGASAMEDKKRQGYF